MMKSTRLKLAEPAENPKRGLGVRTERSRARTVHAPSKLLELHSLSVGQVK